MYYGERWRTSKLTPAYQYLNCTAVSWSLLKVEHVDRVEDDTQVSVLNSLVNSGAIL